MSGRARLVALNTGLAVVAVALVLPWAEIAGERRHGFGFANLLLRLPAIRPLGEHLAVVGTLWYAIPAATLAAWGAQFTRWPPRPGAVSRIAIAVLVVATAAVAGWLAVRDVGFPAPGPVVALVGAAIAAVGACSPSRRRPGAPSPEGPRRGDAGGER